MPDQLDSIPSTPVLPQGCPLSLVLTTVMSAPKISILPMYQAAADLLGLSVPDMPLIQEHSTMVVLPSVQLAPSALVTDLSVWALSPTLLHIQGPEFQLASNSILKKLPSQMLSSVPMTISVQSTAVGLVPTSSQYRM